MAGDVDVFSAYPAPENFAQFAADRRFKVFVGSTEAETVLALNNRRPPLSLLPVRRAIAHAIDRRALNDGAMFGYATPIGSHFPPHSPDYVDLTGMYPHDIARARALLAEAGYPQGFSVTLKLPPPSYARRAGEIVASQLAAVGIRVTIENLEWAQWLDQVFARHDFDMSIVAHVEPMDYDIYARDDYYFGYSNAGFKALIAALDDTIDPARRHELLGEIQRKLAQDAVNGFLFQLPRLAVWNAHLHGVGFENPFDTIELAGAYDDRPNETGAAPARVAVVARGAVWLAAAAALLLVALAARRFGAVALSERLAVLLLTLVGATAVVFVIVQVVPGDPVRYMMGLQAQPDTVAAMRRVLGLDAGPLRALPALGCRPGARGLRIELHLPSTGEVADRRAAAGVAAACALCARARRECGVSGGLRRGRAARTRERCVAHELDAARTRHPEFLARDAARAGIRDRTACNFGRGVPRLGSGILDGTARADAARRGPRHAPGGDPRAGPARRPGGYPTRGLHPHGACQGRERAPHPLAARAAECARSRYSRYSACSSPSCSRAA